MTGPGARRAAPGCAVALVALLALGSAAILPARGEATEQVTAIPTRPGVTVGVLLVTPEQPPVASVVLFPGGHGRLNLTPGGMSWGAGNFLVRTRARFAERGLLVAVIDSPSDQGEDGLWKFRTTDAHAQDVAAVVALLREKASVPVWLVGTSAGSVSAANAAARRREPMANGLVLTSTVMRANRQILYSVEDVKLKDITIPTLFVHHREDACPSTPYSDVAGTMKRLSSAPRVELLSFSGGDPPRSAACEAYAPHGFLGIETQVVAAIADWIKAAGAK